MKELTEFRNGMDSAITTAKEKGLAFTVKYLASKDTDKYTPSLIAAYWNGYAMGIQYVRQEHKRFCN